MWTTLILSVICLTSLIEASPKWRIVNGQTANEHEFKSIVSLQYYGQQHICGGTLLDSTTVLTAAHCVFDFRSQSPGIMYVRAGEHNFNVRSGRERQSQVSRWIMHPYYQTQNHYLQGDDIAILKLASSIQEENHIRFGTLPPAGDDFVRPNEIVTVAGWGSINPNGRVPATILQKTQLYVYSNQDCSRYYQNVARNGNKNICAGRYQEQIGSCQGDSGGPLYFTKGNVQYVLGVVSYGASPCAQSNIPVAYTRVSTYVNWINSVRR
jgi:secreted trypsin-like serine protease